MTLEQFKQSLTKPQPPALPPVLEAMWHDGKEDWEQAHNIAQEIHNQEGSWIHAYLHRKEGDNGNALYWYQRAGKKMPGVSLQEEWEGIVKALLGID
jgi:hypothetical protein